MADISINDIAEKLKVNKSTVSRALNNQKGVSKEMRQRILEEVENMKYLKNYNAQALGGKRDKTIGVFINQHETTMISPYIVAEKLEGIGKIAARKGYRVIIFYNNWDENLSELWNNISNSGICGMIALDPFRASVHDKVRNYDIPLITLNWFREIETPKTECWIHTDTSASLRGMIEHMMEKGYKDIGVINWLSYPFHLDNICGEIEKMRQEYSELKVDIWHTDLKRSRKEIYDYLQKNPKRAYISLYYLYGFWILDYCREKRIKVPDETAVSIYDYNPIMAIREMQISGAMQQTQKMGMLAAEKLIDMIDGKEVESQWVDTVFVPGETT